MRKNIRTIWYGQADQFQKVIDRHIGKKIIISNRFQTHLTPRPPSLKGKGETSPLSFQGRGWGRGVLIANWHKDIPTPNIHFFPY